MADTPTFTVEYDVSSGGFSGYRTFIENLRSRRELVARRVRSLSVFPQFRRDVARVEWFHIVLRATDNAGAAHRITLAIRTDNLYLDAYQNDRDQWLQFGTINIHGATSLGSGAYDGQLGAAMIGRESLVNAISYLATSNNEDSRKTKRSLVVLMVMICEALRFNSISHEFITELLRRNLNTQFDGYGQGEQHDESERETRRRYMRQINGWGNLSEAVLRSDAIGGDHFPQFPDMGIGSFQTAIFVLGMLRFYCWPRNNYNTDDDYEAQDESCAAGHPLMEIFHLVITYIDGENPGDLFGTIQVVDSMGSQTIYDRSRENYESISPGDNATLIGPTRAIRCLDDVVINFNLKDKDADFSPDDNIIIDVINWNVYDLSNAYDTVKSIGVSGSGTYGNGSFVYAVMDNAVPANVRIELVNGDGENPANVYGKITAYTSKFKDNQILLFQKGSNDYINIRPGASIPLLRYVVVVPLGESLSIEAHLWDQDTFSWDDEIANGTKSFDAKISGSPDQSITGKYGEIKVYIDWNKGFE